MKDASAGCSILYYGRDSFRNSHFISKRRNFFSYYKKPFQYYNSTICVSLSELYTGFDIDIQYTPSVHNISPHNLQNFSLKLLLWTFFLGISNIYMINSADENDMKENILHTVLLFHFLEVCPRHPDFFGAFISHCVTNCLLLRLAWLLALPPFFKKINK
jgi:hypothetical protein